MTGPGHERLSLDPDRTRQGAVDGVWWPATYDAGAELPALIAAIDQRLNRRVLRVGLHVDTWDNIPHRIAAPRLHVKVGWFRTIDPHVVNLIIPGIEHLDLLIIPPDTTPAAAHKALAMATRWRADSRGRTRPGDILAAAGQDGPADAIAQQELSLAGWDNGGGQTRQPACGDPAS